MLHAHRQWLSSRGSQALRKGQRWREALGSSFGSSSGARAGTRRWLSHCGCAASLLLACSASPAGSTPTAPAASPAQLAPAAAEAKASVAERTPTTQAAALVQALMAGEAELATVDFSPKLKQKLSSEQLAAVWANLDREFGRAVSHEAPRPQNDTVRTVLCFERAKLELVLNFESSRVSGLHFAPVSEPAWQAPSYVHPDMFDERELSVGQPELALPAVLTIPRGSRPTPVVVLVHGSGPIDRDATLGPNKPFKDLAWGLASRGVAVLRYDKRTLTHGRRIAASMAEGGPFTVREEVVDDALSAIRALRGSSETGPIFVAGHSLGGYLGPRIATLDGGLAGLVILAGPSRPLEDLFIEQSEYLVRLDGTVSNEERAVLDQNREHANAVRELAHSRKASTGKRPFGLPESYWLDLAGYDPVASAKRLSCPILVIQGQRDFQSTRTDFEVWEQALGGKSKCRLRSYAGLNHLFMAGEGPSAPEEYERPGHVDAAVIDDIAAFVKGTP